MAYTTSIDHDALSRRQCWNIIDHVFIYFCLLDALFWLTSFGHFINTIVYDSTLSRSHSPNIASYLQIWIISWLFPLLFRAASFRVG